MSEPTDAELVELFAGHPIDRDAAAHYRGRLERRLLLNRCHECGHWHHPPRPVCPRCWSTSVLAVPVSGSGSIHLLTFLHHGTVGGGDGSPYPLATVELDEQPGLRFSGGVIGAPPGEIAIGRRVQLDWIEREGVPVPAFRLAIGAPT